MGRAPGSGVCRAWHAVDMVREVKWGRWASYDRRQGRSAVLDGGSAAQALALDGDAAVRAAARDLLTAIDGHICETCRPA
ncbi:hypothetical protein ACIQNU_38645 [Streptomyces sp. NPDC091292]|uniref:hypothetical protein n=1 Tax=Streptomyces sp. NPDC091292 TaxID=3365991 RepID=UPI003816A15E